MLLYYFRLLIIMFFCCNQNIYSQQNRIKVFPEDSEVFFKEFKNFMNVSADSEQKEVVSIFEKQYKKGSISSDNFLKIKEILDLMLKKKKKPNTHFNYFIKSINSFSNSKYFEKDLDDWISIVDYFINKSTNSRLIKFLGFSDGFFSDNTLHSNKSLVWGIDFNNVDFILDSIPLVSFNSSVDLYCHSRGDTILISSTTGYYNPISNVWHGESGVVDWRRAGFDKDKVYVNLKDYKIRTRIAGFDANFVKFFNKDIFGEDYLEGSFSDKLVSNKGSNSIYPSFKSNNYDVVINNILPNINFVGVYSLQGSNFVSSSDNIPATLIFLKDNKKIVSASSSNITINDNLIVTNSSTVNIYLDNDSIINSDVMLKYFIDKNEFSLISSFSYSISPYYNSYHEIDMYFDVLTWNTGDDKMYFGSMPQSKKPARFVSSDYFTRSSFNALRGIDNVHPLLRLKNFIKDNNLDNSFDINYFLKNFNLPSDQSLKFIDNLNSLGFVIIDYKKNKIIVKDKLFKYLQAYARQVDFDNIEFKSRNSNSNINAELDLASMNLKIFGVSVIPISQIRNVYVYPKSDFIVLKNNRDFSFSGSVHSSLGDKFKIHGKNIDFHYDDFKFTFTKADSLSMKVPSVPLVLDNNGFPVLEKILIPIQNFSGELLIDDINNKSGNWVKDFGNYPILRGYEKSRVFYDDPSIYNGVYARDNFYFDVDPFEIDSLDSFRRESLNFPGTFYSADIFSPFHERLVVQKDNSLGFATSTSEKGLTVYGKGEYFNNIFLDKNGLTGNGMLNYSNVTSLSDMFVFFPDSITSNVNSLVFNDIPKYDYPEVTGKKVFQHVDIQKNLVKVSSLNGDLRLYDSTAFFTGDIFLENNIVHSKGTLSMDKFDIYSNYFNLFKNSIQSDTADFVLKTSSGLSDMAFESVNLKTNIDLNKKIGTFTSNGKKSFVAFKKNQYISYIDVLNWFMDKDILALGPLEKELGVNYSGSEFVSVHPDQDSLSFVAESAEYNLSDYVIYAHGIDSFKIANGYIYPNEGDIKIMDNAKIEKINNSKIVFDGREIQNCEINILGKLDFIANGTYVFSNNNNDSISLFLDSIYVDDKKINAKSLNQNNIVLNDKFKFKGDVDITSNQKDLLYMGFVDINSECFLLDKKTISVNQYINMDTISILIDNNTVNENSNNLYSGLYFNEFDLGFAVLDYLDFNIHEVCAYKGYLSSKNNTFYIGDSKSSFYVEESQCVVKGNGIFDFGFDFGVCEEVIVGQFEFDVNKNIFSSKCMLGLDFELDKKKSFSIIGESIQDDIMLEELDIEETFYVPVFNLFLNEDEVYDYDLYGEFKQIPSMLNKSLFFYNVELKWDNENKFLYSLKNLDLGNIKDYQINKNLKGGVILDKFNNSFDVLIKSEYESYDFYFFSYNNKDKKLSLFSQNTDLMNHIGDIKKSKRQEKHKKKIIYFYDLFESENEKEIFEDKLNKL